MRKLRYLDFFAGIGGFHSAFERVGWECVGFCEIDKFARQSYKAIHNVEGAKEWHDITTVTDEEFATLHGQVDVIAGGFPCQAFSVAGKRGGFEDSRGTLFFEVARAAKAIKPKYLVLENVKGLLSSESSSDYEAGLSSLAMNIQEATVWEEKNTQKNRLNLFEKNLTHFIRKKLDIVSDSQSAKSGTLSIQGLDVSLESLEQEVVRGMSVNLKSSATKILQIIKKSNSFPDGPLVQLDKIGEEWVSIQKQLSSKDGLRVMDTTMLESLENMNETVELLLKRRLADHYVGTKSSTISTESRRMTDQKIFMYVQEQIILLYMLKQWRSSSRCWKKVLSLLTKSHKNTFLEMTFDVILRTLNELGYTVDFEVLNTKFFGVPQNRERIFIVAVRDDLVAQEAWNIAGTGVVAKAKKRFSGAAGVKSFNFFGWASAYDVVGAKLRDVLETEVDAKYYLSEERTANLIEKSADNPNITQVVADLNHYSQESLNRIYGVDGQASPINTMQGGGREPKIAEPSIHATLTPDRAEKRQNGRRFKDNDEPMFTLTAQDKHGIATVQYSRKTGIGKDIDTAVCLSASDWRGMNRNQAQNAVLETSPTFRIRKLTPLECWRLQDFTDEQFAKARAAGVSDSQLYKQAGNSVTVKVVEVIAHNLAALDASLR